MSDYVKLLQQKDRTIKALILIGMTQSSATIYGLGQLGCLVLEETLGQSTLLMLGVLLTVLPLLVFSLGVYLSVAPGDNSYDKPLTNDDHQLRKMVKERT